MPSHTTEPSPRQPQTPVWAIVLTSCAVIATAHLLGVPSLAELSLGLPIGLWLAIAIACAWTAFTLSAASLATSPSTPIATSPTSTSTLAGGAGVSPASTNTPHSLFNLPPLSLSAELLTRAAALLGELLSLALRAALAGAPSLRPRTTDPESVLCSLHDRIRWPARPLRIGLDLSDADATAITRDAPRFGVRWFRVSDTPDLMAACRRHRLDAVVSRHGTGPVRIVTNERAGRDAARIDWAAVETPSLAAVFPYRIDTQGVTIDAPAPLSVSDAAAVRNLALAAGALARHPSRLGLPDRLFGRRPIADHAALMHRLADRLDEPSPAERTIARAVSAWAVAHAPSSSAAPHTPAPTRWSNSASPPPASPRATTGAPSPPSCTPTASSVQATRPRVSTMPPLSSLNSDAATTPRRRSAASPSASASSARQPRSNASASSATTLTRRCASPPGSSAATRTADSSSKSSANSNAAEEPTNSACRQA
ncbi:MAG: hypothetical protein M5U20_11365 [Phycisphaerales bacterium]|nr:hypothetical protein [Phycisphaerales bacterium]